MAVFPLTTTSQYGPVNAPGGAHVSPQEGGGWGGWGDTGPKWLFDSGEAAASLNFNGKF